MADTTQPAGALPEPAFGYEEHGGGRQFSADQMRAMMAERDAAREAADDLRLELAAVLSDWNSLVKAIGSPKNGVAVGYAAALRRELEELRAIPPDARDCTDGDGHVYAAVSKAHATPEQNAAVEASIERVAAFAREGREPLTDEALKALWRHAGRQTFGHPVTARALVFGRLVFARSVGPAGTSADGETQP